MTLFEKIISRELQADILKEERDWIAFRDIHPQAPTHILIVPKKPIARLEQAKEADQQLLGALLLAAVQIAREENLEHGFRIVINNGTEGGETIPHLHVHLLGGRQLVWPPG